MSLLPGPQVEMSVEAVNGIPKGAGGIHGGPTRGRGRGGARGGVSRFSGGRDDMNNRSNTMRANDNNRAPFKGNNDNRPSNRPNNDNRAPLRANVKSETEVEVKTENNMDNRGGSVQGGRGGGNNNNNRGRERFARRDDGLRGGGGGRNQDERLMDRVNAMSGSTYDLAPLDQTERKFSGHCRLYIGNLTSDVSEEEMTALFAPFGQSAELFLNKEKNFAFIRMDYRVSAEKAKRELDGFLRKGRALKVRFAPHTASIKVKNLTQHVSNELLENAFSVFGEIERAYVIVDDRGKPQGEGIVEFARKPGAQLAIRKCTEQCFFLTSSLRPVIVEPYEQLVDPDGFPEKNMFKKSPDYLKAREVGPRFASADSFEHDYGTRWKQLHELRKTKMEALDREMKMEEEKLEAQMEYARYEHETEMLRDQLRQREQDRERQKRDWEMKERQQEEQRRQDEEMMRHQQEEMQMRILHQEEEMRRRQQENSLFMQAHQLTSLLDQQEQALRTGSGYSPIPPEYEQGMAGDSYGNMRGNGGPGNLPVDPKAFMDTYDRGVQGRYDAGGPGMEEMGGRGVGMGGGAGGMNRPRWGGNGGQGVGDRRGPIVDDYPSKRRRY